MPTEITSATPGRAIRSYDLLDEITDRHALSDREAHDMIHAYLDQLIQDDGEDTVILARRPVKPALLASNSLDRDIVWWLTISDDAVTAIREAVEAVHPELLTLEQIGVDVLGSQAKAPSKAASRAMSRLRLRPAEYRPHPDSGRPQALYGAREVRAAVATRLGQGARTDRPT
jgi:hypothetical protein